MQDLPQKLEAAGKELVDSGGFTMTTVEGDLPVKAFTGTDNDVKQLPAVIIIAQGGPEMPQGSGNFMMTLAVEFRANANDVGLDHFRYVAAQVLGVFMSDGLAEELAGAVPELGVFGIQNRQAGGSRVDEGVWVSELQMEVYCCGQSVTA